VGLDDESYIRDRVVKLLENRHFWLIYVVILGVPDGRDSKNWTDGPAYASIFQNQSNDCFVVFDEAITYDTGPVALV
jgi:hypothetical protein